MVMKLEIPPQAEALIGRVRVNAPAVLLKEGLWRPLVRFGLRPEVGLDHRALDNMTWAEFTELAGIFSRAGLRPSVHGPFLDLSPGAKDPRVLALTRERLDRAVEIAVLFGAEHMVCHHNFNEDAHSFYTEEWLEISRETWTAVARRAREAGIRLVLENTYERKPAQMLPLLSSLEPEGVGFCFDLGHANCFGRTPLANWIDTLAPRLAVVHLHDNDGGFDDHLPIGCGVIDFSGLLSRLAETLDRPPAVTLEPHKEEDVAVTLAGLAKVWPWQA